MDNNSINQTQSQQAYSPLLNDYAAIKEKNSAVLNVINYAHQYSQRGFLDKLTQTIGVPYISSGNRQEEKYINDFANKTGIATFSAYADLPFMKGMRTSSERRITLSTQENARSSLEKLYEQSVLEGDLRTARDALNQLQMVRNIPVYAAESSSQHRSMQKVMLDISERAAYKVVAPVNSQAIQSFYRDADSSDSEIFGNTILSSSYALADIFNRISKASGYLSGDQNTYMPTPSISEIYQPEMDNRALTISNAIQAGSIFALSYGVAPVQSSGLQAVLSRGLYAGASTEIIPQISEYMLNKSIDTFGGNLTENQKDSYRKSVFNDLFAIGAQSAFHSLYSKKYSRPYDSIKDKLGRFVDDNNENINRSSSSSNGFNNEETIGANGEKIHETTILQSPIDDSINIPSFNMEGYQTSVMRDLQNIAYSEIDSIPAQHEASIKYISDMHTNEGYFSPTMTDALNAGISIDIVPYSGNMYLNKQIMKVVDLSNDVELSKQAIINQHKKGMAEAVFYNISGGRELESFEANNDFTLPYDQIIAVEDVITDKMNSLYDNARSSIDFSSINLPSAMHQMQNAANNIEEIFNEVVSTLIGTEDNGVFHLKEVKRLFPIMANVLKSAENSQDIFDAIREFRSTTSSVERMMPQSSPYSRGKTKRFMTSLKNLGNSLLLNIFGEGTYGLMKYADLQYRGFRQTGIDKVKDFLITNTMLYDKKMSKKKNSLSSFYSQFYSNMKNYVLSSQLFSPEEMQGIGSNLDESASSLLKFAFCSKYVDQSGIKPDKMRNNILSDNTVQSLYHSITGDTENAKLKDLVGYANYSAEYYNKFTNYSNTAFSAEALSELHPSIKNMKKAGARFLKNQTWEEAIKEMIYNPVYQRVIVALSNKNNGDVS